MKCLITVITFYKRETSSFSAAYIRNTNAGIKWLICIYL